jgi:hypothetical protein
MSDAKCILCLRTDDLLWVFNENVPSNMAEMIRAISSVEVGLYSGFFLRLAIGFYMLIFQPPVNFCFVEIFKPFLEQSWEIFQTIG